LKAELKASLRLYNEAKMQLLRVYDHG